MVNDPYFIVLEMFAFAGAGLWIFFIRRFTQHLYKNYPDTYQALGEPPVELKRRYSISDISAILSEIRFILSAGYRKLGDRKFTRFSDRLRTLFIVDFILIVFVLTVQSQDIFSGPRQTRSSNVNTAASSIYEAYNKYQSHEYTASLDILNEVLASEPDNTEAHFYRGFTNEALGDYPGALADFIKVVELDPDRFDAYTHIDWLYARNNQWEKIIPYWDTYIERNPNDAKAYLERGGTYYRSGNLEKALSDSSRSCGLGNREGCSRKDQVIQRISVNN